MRDGGCWGEGLLLIRSLRQDDSFRQDISYDFVVVYLGHGSSGQRALKAWGNLEQPHDVS